MNTKKAIREHTGHILTSPIGLAEDTVRMLSSNRYIIPITNVKRPRHCNKLARCHYLAYVYLSGAGLYDLISSLLYIQHTMIHTFLVYVCHLRLLPVSVVVSLMILILRCKLFYFLSQKSKPMLTLHINPTSLVFHKGNTRAWANVCPASSQKDALDLGTTYVLKRGQTNVMT